MTIPTNKAEALALLTAIGSDKISGSDLQDVLEWEDARLVELEERASLLETNMSGVITTVVSEPVAVTMDRNQSIDLSGVGSTYGTSLAVSLAASGHVDNTTTTIFVGAYSRTSAAFSDDMHVEMSDGSAFDFDDEVDLVVVARRVFGKTFSQAYTIARTSRSGAQIMLAVVPTSQPDTLELWCTGPMKFASLAQVSITGTMAVTRNITGIKSGNGTTRVILQLSGALASTDIVNLVFGASHTFADLSSRRILAQTIATFWYSHPTELAGFTSYRDAQYALQPVAPDGDGTWLAPPKPNGQPSDATSIIQIYADRQPSISSNGYAGARTVKCRGIQVTANHTTNTFTIYTATDPVPANDTPIMLICGFTDYVPNPGAMPSGLTADVNRYVVNANTTTRTFQLAATQGGAALDFTTNGNDLYVLFQSLQGVNTMATLVSASTDTCWIAGRANRIQITSPGAPYNRQTIMSAVSTWGFSVDKGAGADTCVVGANGLDAGGYISGADVPCEEGAPMLVRRRHTGGQLYVRRDRLTESVGVAAGDFTSLSSNIIIGARQVDMAGACDSDFFAYVTTNSVQTAQYNEGIESFFTLQPWGRFLRHDLFEPPETLDVVVGRTAYLYWNQFHESAGGPSQYTYSCSGGGTASADGWSFAPDVGDIGTRTITIVASLDGRPVATRAFTLNVIAASTTGTCRLLQIGDSWTNGFNLPDGVRAALVTDGLTVSVYGSVGGRVVSVNAGTNVWTSTAHGYTNNEPVRLFKARNSGILPTAVGGDLVEGTYYYIETIDASTFGLRRTIDGARIDVTSTGTGTLYVCADDEKNEGRGGWKVSDYMNEPTHTSEGFSPFRDPTTGLWSWSYYQTTYCGGLEPHIIVIQLLINGLLAGTYPDGVTTYIVDHDNLSSVAAMIDLQFAHLEHMIGGVLANTTTSKIILLNPSKQGNLQSGFRIGVGAQPPDVIAQDKLQRTVQEINRRVREQFGGRESQRLYVASGAVMDRANDYQAAVDPFHPVPTGYLKQSNNLAATARRALAAV